MSEVRLFAITLETLVEADPFHMLYPFSGDDFPSQTQAFSGGLARTAWPQGVFRRWSSSQMSTFWKIMFALNNLKRASFGLSSPEDISQADERTRLKIQIHSCFIALRL